MQQTERTSILVHGLSQSQSSSSRPTQSQSQSHLLHDDSTHSNHYHTGNEVDDHTGSDFDSDDTKHSWWSKVRATSSSCSSTQACWAATAVAALLLLFFIILSLSSSSSSSSSASPPPPQSLSEVVLPEVSAAKVVNANVNDQVVPPSPVTFASKAGSQLQSVLPIPSAPEGFCLGGCSSPSLPGRDIELELYFDLLCPYSAEAWPTIKRVIQHYDTKNKNNNNDAMIPRLHVQLHLFPLPYHMFAFIVNQATFAVQQTQLQKSKNEKEETANEKVRESVIQWMELIFKNQNRFQEHVLSKRVSEILDTVNEMGRSSSLLPSSLTNSTEGLASDFDTNMALRTSFKIACQRGVTGTPQFFLNGVMLFADSGWKMADWTSLIDSLLTPERAA